MRQFYRKGDGFSDPKVTARFLEEGKTLIDQSLIS